MGNLCSNCGRELEVHEQFCKECGMRVLVDRGSIRQKANPRRKAPLLVAFSVIGLAVLSIAAYFVVDDLKESKRKPTPVVSKPEKEIADKTSDMKKEKEAAVEKGEEEILERYTKQLNALKIHTSGLDISVGEWKISSDNGRVYLEAAQIPAKDLARIFDVYDTGNLKSLKSWAKEVYYIAEDLSRELEVKWTIEVGNACVSEYPETLSSSDLSAYSGSCGYSIPVLSGSEKDDLSLVIHTNVFGSPDYVQRPAPPASPPPAPKPKPAPAPVPPPSPSEYFFPYSDTWRLSESEIAPLSLSQLRLARNEIYARHGYIFKSADLQAYFSKKSWYFPDAYYDGTTLNEVEKYNVELIKNRESYLK